uniref:uncharacterized protein At1g01500-like isoform X1 n=1 Tax=Erigeron canadensis TaxID=72917 RepID=UPI001CB9B347|nr:uncharacterized protein At1g01500-like isoform X1 [Erigeron canadensis]XP_043614328.1 uncharacterized protein At1g01500-like isoform X2 [Erigeron canadensis]XP_043614329.1 uncharacterized protein At1g01500-like isoform X1 [Erigeron canadensis]
MENDLYETVKKKNSKVTNNGLQIIKHPSYQTYGKRLLSWFDIRVFYFRISNFMVDGGTPAYLTLNLIPLDPDTVLEVNGRRCTLNSEGSSCHLKRNRVDTKFEEVTFVSTYNIRLSGNVKFEVFNGNDLILSGALDISKEKNGDTGKWSMNCESMIYGSNGFFMDKRMVVCDSLPPMVEVYVAGSFSETPIILTKTLQINLKKKQNRTGTLNTIPEYETDAYQKDVAPGLDFQTAGYRHHKLGNEENYDSNAYWSQTEYMEGEDSALSWFNAGVRVGVGIGLGVCIGAGIGVGLVVRMYQSTTRNFRRRL